MGEEAVDDLVNAHAGFAPDGWSQSAWRRDEGLAHIIQRLVTNPWTKALLSINDLFQQSSGEFFQREQIKAVQLPLTTHSVSSPVGLGSDSLPVQVTLEGVDTYLADSMQFMLELGCRIADGGVYYIMPSFRGETADERHLCQFFHSEAEIPGGLEDVMALIERYVTHLAGAFLLRHDEWRVSADADLSHVEAAGARGEEGFARVSHAEAVARLDQPEHTMSVAGGGHVVTAAGERELLRQFGGGPVWLTGAPVLAVPFYQAVQEQTPECAETADLLMGIGETVGAGARHATGSATRDALLRHQVDEGDYEWYVTMKDVAPLKTAGFGMGVERFMLWLLRHSDIRDMQILKRFNGEYSVP